MQPHQIIRTRLRTELDKHRISAVELARRAGVKTSFIYDILNGKSTNPSTVKLALVAESLGVSLAYLAGATTASSVASGHHQDAVEIPYLNMGKSGKTKKTEASATFHRQWLKETLGIEPGKLRLALLSGDVMAPTLLEGDLLMVDTGNTTPAPSGIFMLADGNNGIAKRLELMSGGKQPMIRVLSDNPRYSTYERPATDLNILGRIVWFSRII